MITIFSFALFFSRILFLPNLQKREIKSYVYPSKLTYRTWDFIIFKWIFFIKKLKLQISQNALSDECWSTSFDKTYDLRVSH